MFMYCNNSLITPLILLQKASIESMNVLQLIKQRHDVLFSTELDVNSLRNKILLNIC